MKIIFLLSVLICVVSAFRVAPSVADSDCNSNPWPSDRQNNRIAYGGNLSVGSFIESKNSKLEFKANGQLTLTQKKDGLVLWSSPVPASGTNPSHASVGPNGLVLVDNNGNTFWSTQVSSPDTAVLVLVDSCDLVLFTQAPFNTPLWSTATGYCLDVHVTPHSHDDVGWLLTPERYYDGCYDPQGGVQSIIRTMVEALYADANRTFVQVEQYFFNRWWERQDEEMKQKTRTVVDRGQFIFINGGWSMHDEACVHQESAVNNMARGAQFIREEFGQTANLTVGWHIDPFGHASSTPRLMSQMGFNSFWFQRVDYQDRQQMQLTRTLETMWSPSPTLGDAYNMFTSIMVDGYCKGCDVGMCPSGFCCFSCEDADGSPTWAAELIAAKRAMAPQTDVEKVRRLFKVQAGKPLSVQSMADAVVEDYRQYATNFRTDQVLIPWGCDFEHIDASVSFDLMDSVIAAIRANPQYSAFNIFYSHPQRYTDSIIKEGYKWPVNKYDYFLDSDDGHSYWSGYFSSRAEYKHWERVLMNQMTSSDILLSTLQPDPDTFSLRWNGVDKLRRALGVAQHHDSITGTERLSVRNQYQKILHEGSIAAEEAQGSMLAEVTGLEAPRVCSLANLSTCAETQSLSSYESVTVILYNPLVWDRDEVVVVPIPINTVTVTDANNNPITSQIQDTWEMTTTADPPSPPSSPMQYELLFSVSIKSLGFATVTLNPFGNANYVPATTFSGMVKLSNSYITAVVDANKGLVQLTNPDGSSTPVTHNYYWYCPMNNSNGEQASGAYIFRPCTPDATPTAFTNSFNSKSVVGPVCTEVRSIVDTANNIHQTIRLCKNDRHLSIQTGIGEIQPGTVGKEVVMKIQTNVASDAKWYTDSQALEMQERVRNHRPNYPYTVTEPVAANFFPCNQWTYITSSNATFAVVGDISRAVSSLKDGELEFLIIRRLLFDDARGVGQALNESIRVITTSRLYYGSKSADVITNARIGAVLHTHTLTQFYSQAGAAVDPVKSSGKRIRSNITLSSKDGSILPENVFLHTRQLLDPNTLLVRLQHLFAAGESSLSTDVTVDLKAILPTSGSLGTATIANVVEYDLNGVTTLEDINKMRRTYTTCSADGKVSETPTKFAPALDGQTVTLKPMDLRTFILNIQWK